jgi:Meiotically Up-regulated Gene 113 (MUG113) protein
MINKEKILEEIKRTAVENNGKPLGIDLFKEETGIRREDWYGKYWSKWSDALREAGFEPNPFGKPKLDKVWVLEKVSEFTRELGHFPAKGELKLRKQYDKEFPSPDTLQKYLGKKEDMVKSLLEYCRTKESLSDVIDICLNAQATIPKNDKLDDGSNDGEIQYGQVYLLKHGKDYKIGKSTSVTERYKSIQTQMPHKLEEIHVIETDDISGIENYWHKRFKKKRLKGEWFNLTAADIKAFKKRKFQ